MVKSLNNKTVKFPQCVFWTRWLSWTRQLTSSNLSSYNKSKTVKIRTAPPASVTTYTTWWKLMSNEKNLTSQRSQEYTKKFSQMRNSTFWTSYQGQSLKCLVWAFKIEAQVPQSGHLTIWKIKVRLTRWPWNSSKRLRTWHCAYLRLCQMWSFTNSANQE